MDDERMGRAPLSREHIEWAYRLFLDREPENEEVIAARLRSLRSTAELRADFMQCGEFYQRTPHLKRTTLVGDEPRNPIESVDAQEALCVLFAHVQATWQQLGETEPHWSVLTMEQFRRSNIEGSRDAFYDSGRQHVQLLIKALERNEIDASRFRSCLEFGCGLGRVTQWLSQIFPVVYGYDISAAHLAAAREHLGSVAVSNAELRRIATIEDIMHLPRVDVVYSVLVLQHNPPPLIELILRQLLGSLNSDGVALFQVPTYRIGYRFSLQDYVSSLATERKMEMHLIPQRRVFEIVAECGASVLEILEDAWAGMNYKEVSNTILVRKD